jgi:hypothetical protein
VGFGKVLGGTIGTAAAIVAIVVGVVELHKDMEHPATFSGSVASYVSSVNFASFLNANETKTVTLNVICDQSAGPACDLTAGSGPAGVEMRLYSSANAAPCWTPSSDCPGGALVTFVTSADGTGTLSSPGAGYLSITGTWLVRNDSSGGVSPEGDPNYELDATS